MKMRRLLVILVGGGGLLMGSVAVASLYPNDVTYENSFGHGEAILWVLDRGYFRGYPDGTFKPEKRITAKQMATVIQRMEDRGAFGQDGLSRVEFASFLKAGYGSVQCGGGIRIEDDLGAICSSEESWAMLHRQRWSQ